MNAPNIRRWSLVFVVIVLGVWWVSSTTNWLGIYGTPGDTYHLVVLTLVIFIAYLALVNALYLRGDSEA